MKHSGEIARAIAAFFEKSGWDYEYEEKWGAFFVKRRVPNAAGCVYLTVGVYEDKYIVFARILDFFARRRIETNWRCCFPRSTAKSRSAGSSLILGTATCSIATPSTAPA